MLNGCDEISDFAGIRIDHFKFDCPGVGVYAAVTTAPDCSVAISLAITTEYLSPIGGCEERGRDELRRRARFKF